MSLLNFTFDGLKRRGILFALLAASVGASANGAYPTRAVTIINPWAAGGPSDSFIRPIAQELGTRLGQPVVIDNKSGANGTIGATYVARAKPDGYTLFFSHLNPIAIAPSLQPKPPYDSVKDFAPITLIASGPAVLVVRSDFPANNLAEFLAYAKANPNKVSYGSVGIGSNTHLAGSMLADAGKVEMVHVPYRGSSAIQTDILGGQISSAFVNLSGALGLIQQGRLRPLAVSTTKRSSALPQTPAVAETLPGFEVNGWYGLMAPANTPPEIIKKLNTEVTAILKMPEIVSRLKDGGMEPAPLTPEAYAAMIKSEIPRWAAAAKAAHLD
ncbi:MAG: tripartite tricarboxylate transporter substrate binding protein [Ottowia sp.]|uniref:Bug family tripartite tricarboxylate transporter substrate binding protein n=1 Tax=unclassified Ottowia TaxID=2645081 RepID=UPI003C2D3E7B